MPAAPKHHPKDTASVAGSSSSSSSDNSSRKRKRSSKNKPSNGANEDEQQPKKPFAAKALLANGHRRNSTSKAARDPRDSAHAVAVRQPTPVVDHDGLSRTGNAPSPFLSSPVTVLCLC